MITPEQTQAIQDLMKTSGYTPPTQAADWHSQIKGAAPTGEQPTDIGQEVASQWSGAAQKIGSSISGGAEKMSQGIEQGGLGGLGKYALGAGESALGTASGAVQAIFAPLTGIMQKVADTTGFHPMDNISKYLQEQHPEVLNWAQQHPEMVTNLMDALNVGLGVAGGKADTKIPNFGETLKGVPSDIAAAAKGTVEKGVGLIKGPPETPTTLAGKITQATPEELPAAQRALSTIDLSKAKTFADASKITDESIKKDMAKVDTALTSDVKLKPENVTSDIKVGNKTVSVNHVSDALSQLQDYYAKTNAYADEARIADMKSRFESEGLNPKEINDIAREHGRELNAYNASGELASGLKRQAAENTRTGVKETARDVMPDAGTRAIDKSITDKINLKQMFDDMQTKVQTAENKLRTSGLLKKIGEGLGTGADIVTGGLVKGIARKFLGIGAPESATLSPVELQARLPKLLKQFDKINKMNPQEAANAVEELFKVPITVETPYTKSIKIEGGTKIPVKDVTPESQPVLPTIRQ